MKTVKEGCVVPDSSSNTDTPVQMTEFLSCTKKLFFSSFPN